VPCMGCLLSSGFRPETSFSLLSYRFLCSNALQRELKAYLVVSKLCGVLVGIQIGVICGSSRTLSTFKDLGVGAFVVMMVAIFALRFLH
jgi:ABC-type transporter Mla maintaining outer membrane lipid asymmetry permease subunit MlaE